MASLSVAALAERVSRKAGGVFGKYGAPVSISGREMVVVAAVSIRRTDRIALIRLRHWVILQGQEYGGGDGVLCGDKPAFPKPVPLRDTGDGGRRG